MGFRTQTENFKQPKQNRAVFLLQTKRSNEAHVGAFGDSVLFVNTKAGYDTGLFAEAERDFW